MKKTIIVQVPATIANLGPGFDSFGAAIELRNTFIVEILDRAGGRPSSSSPEIIIEGEGAGILPTDSRNLVWRSMKKVFAACGLKNTPRIRLTTKNAIPLSSGLGSSAAAVVGGLLAANEICYNKLSREDLIQIAVGIEGHPDNAAPAFAGGFCVSFEENGRTGYAGIKMARSGLKAAVCVPRIDFPTAHARGILPGSVKMADAVYNLSRSALFVAAIESRDRGLLKVAVGDRLHQRRRMECIPGAAAAFAAAVKAGAYGVCVSGAGPSVVALCSPDKALQASRAMAEAFRRKGIKSRVLALDFTDVGATVSRRGYDLNIGGRVVKYKT